MKITVSFIRTLFRRAELLFWNLGHPYAQTQKPNLKFENPTTEEMEMTSCSIEPNAPAVVLCKLDDVNYGVSDGSFCIIYDIKKRIKILKSEGKNYATPGNGAGRPGVAGLIIDPEYDGVGLGAQGSRRSPRSPAPHCCPPRSCRARSSPRR